MLDETTLAQRLVSEVIGTAFLVFVGAGSVPVTLILNGARPVTMAELGVISLAFATVVIAVVYAMGHVSGAHINPAVTVGLAVTRKFPWSEVPAYIAAQVVGAIAGAAAILGVLGMRASDAGLGVSSYTVGWGQAFFAEAIGTFLLVFTVFGVIHRKAAAGFAGLAIGLAVFAAIIPVGPVTGASINPARYFGPLLVQQFAGGTVDWGQLPVYVIAELVGGTLAALAFTFMSMTQADRAPAAGPDLAAPESTVDRGAPAAPGTPTTPGPRTSADARDRVDLSDPEQR